MNNLHDLKAHRMKDDYIKRCQEAREIFIHREMISYLGTEAAIEISKNPERIRDYETPELRAFLIKVMNEWDKTWAKRK